MTRIVTLRPPASNDVWHSRHLAGRPTSLIATCSVSAVPWAWAHQTRPGGLILVDVKTGPHAGNLVALRRLPDRLEGRFLPQWAGFMAMRHDNPAAQPPDRYLPVPAATP